MARGTYTLLLALDRDARIRIGALGERSFRAGGYAYTGSAFGPGGFARVDRHRRLSREPEGTPHWHIDYLLVHPDVRILDVVKTQEKRIECAVAHELVRRFTPIPGVGCSDCDCTSHLVYEADRDRLRGAVDRIHRRRG